MKCLRQLPLKHRKINLGIPSSIKKQLLYTDEKE